MTINPTLAARIAATGVPLSADYAPQPATPRWHQLRTELIRTFRDYMPETAATKAVDLLDEVIAEVLLEGTAEIRRLKAELAAQISYAARLEAAICQCEPHCEDGEYLHVADCPVVEIQMQEFGGPVEEAAS